MDSYQQFIQSIEKRIVSLNTAINKYNLFSSLNPVILELDENTIWDLQEKDVEIIVKNLKEKNQLNPVEIEFLLAFTKIPPNLKQVKKNLLGLDQTQKEIFKSIQQKVEATKKEHDSLNVDFIEKSLEKYKKLLQKLEDNDLILITEIEFISEILTQDAYDASSKMEIYHIINENNSHILKKYKNFISDENDNEKIWDESQLTSTNIPEELLNKLFERFGINWTKNYESISDSKIQQQMINQQAHWKNKLLNYGNYEKMEELLEFLRKKNLNFIFDLPEILTKTLLYSSIQEIEQVINIAKENEINYYELLKSQPVIFFPTVRETKNHSKKYQNSSSEQKTSGALTNFLGNINFLKENNFPINEIFKSSPVFFIRSPKTQRKVYERLKMYGIFLQYPNGNQKKSFSVLGTTDILSKIDIGIECGCYDYYQDNTTKLVNPNLNLYRVKLARLLGIGEDEIFCKRYSTTKGETKKCLSELFWKNNSDKFGKSPEDTYKIYQSCPQETYIDKDNIEIYNNIISNRENDKITALVLNDYLIRQLDSQFKDDQNDLIYNFNGVIISRLKVLRYYQTLISDSNIISGKDVLLYAITLHSMLNQDEVNAINECLKSVKFKGGIK